MRIRRYIPPISILLFLAMTLAGTYYVRKAILEQHMVSAMQLGDGSAVLELAKAFPSPVNACGKLIRWGTPGKSISLSLDNSSRLVSKTTLIPNGWTYEQCTPLHWAASSGREDIVRILVARGADVRARDSIGGTPLHYASATGDGHKKAAELLLANGADVTARNIYGWTPLHVAAADGCNEIVKLLISRGADVNVKDIHGWTPLHVAGRWENKETVEVLILNGADLDAKDGEGNTALRTSEDHHFWDIVKALRKAGAIE